jgi:hypothetical protein
MVITNTCPKCDAKKIKKKVYGKHTSAALLLLIIGLPLCLFGGIGLLLVIPGIILCAISAKKYICQSCGTEWE